MMLQRLADVSFADTAPPPARAVDATMPRVPPPFSAHADMPFQSPLRYAAHMFMLNDK